MNGFEIEILKYINSNLMHPVASEFFKFVSFTGNKGWIWIVIALVLVAIPKTRKAGVCASIALILCLVINNICIKPLAGRMRPYDFEPTLNIIIPLLKDGSFPSGHTCASFAAVFAISKYYKKWSLPLYAYAVFMALSRIYLCVHYPTDVIAGLVLGIGFGFAAYMLNERIWSVRNQM